MFNNFNFWFALMPLLALVVGGLSSLNITVRHYGAKPRFEFIQAVFDIIAFIATVLNTVLMFRESWAGFVQFARDYVPAGRSPLGAAICAVTAIIGINAVYLVLLRFISISVQEIKYAYLKRSYRQKRKAEKYRQMALRDLENDLDAETLKAIEQALDEDLYEAEKSAKTTSRKTKKSGKLLSFPKKQRRIN